MMLNNILVPLDDSANSEEVLPFVMQLALPNPQIKITLLTVTGLDSPRDSASTFKLRSFAELLTSKGIESDFFITESMNVANRINDWADTNSYDMIAMSTRGREGLSRAILGSVATEVLRLASLPVMVVAASRSSKHRLDSPKLIDLVVPLDGSRLSESSLPYVEVIAKSLNLGVRLMNVITPVGLSAQNPVDESSYFFGNKIVPDLYKEYENYLAQTADSLTEKGLNVLSQNVLIGNTASALIGCVKDPSESLFVMSTHGRNGIDRLLIGSVTDSVLRSYGGPVFVIPANATLASVHA